MIEPTQFSTTRLAAEFNPFTYWQEIWRDLDPDDPVTGTLVLECLNEGLYEPEEWTHSHGQWSAEDHCARIAHLIMNGWRDPIELYFDKVSSRTQLRDGCHRLAAAMVLGMPNIAGYWAGDEDVAQEFFHVQR